MAHIEDIPFQFHHQAYHAESWAVGYVLRFSENRVVVLLQYTHRAGIVTVVPVVMFVIQTTLKFFIYLLTRHFTQMTDATLWQYPNIALQLSAKNVVKELCLRLPIAVSFDKLVEQTCRCCCNCWVSSSTSCWRVRTCRTRTSQITVSWRMCRDRQSVTYRSWRVTAIGAAQWSCHRAGRHIV